MRRRHAECTRQAPRHLTSLPHPAEGLLAAFAHFGNFRQELGMRFQGFSVQLSTCAGRAPAFCWACSRKRKQLRSLCMLPSSHTRCCLRHHRQRLLAQREAINTAGPSFPGLQASLLQPTPADVLCPRPRSLCELRLMARSWSSCSGLTGAVCISDSNTNTHPACCVVPGHPENPFRLLTGIGIGGKKSWLKCNCCRIRRRQLC